MSDCSSNESFDEIKKENIENLQKIKHEQLFESCSSESNFDQVKFQEEFQDQGNDCDTKKDFDCKLKKLIKLEPKRSKSIDYHSLELNIKTKVYERIVQFDNKTLYPDLMGPHPLYASENAKTLRKISSLVDLKQKLEEYVKGWIHSKKMKSNPQKKAMQRRIGIKYNKYPMQFKLRTVKKIQQQMIDEGKNAKSLRYYIVKEAAMLKIHPKNITRWFQTKDLQNKQGGRKAKFPILEYKLSKFMNENPQCKRKQVVNQAKRILAETGEDKEFNFSKGWYERFRVRLKQQKVKRSVKDILPKLLSQNDQQQIKIQKLQSLLCKQQLFCEKGSPEESALPFQIVKKSRSDKKQADE